jgi:CheY-like chemotaxis protein
VNCANAEPPLINKEQDYVFLKDLEVIYIDDDLESHKLIMKYAKENIHITACDSLYLAFNIIESHNYDIVLCDMMASPEILKEFFSKYSQKMPVLAISSSMDPKMAYLAAKMGAKDYITKDKQELKSISKILHKVYLEWVKEREQKNSLSLLNDQNVRLVLKDLINTELPITQRIITSLESDIQINDTIINTYDIQANVILAKNPSILKSLIKLQFIKKDFVEQTLVCPNCKSINIFTHYFCDNCKKSNFISKEILLHNKCKQIIIDKKVHRHGQLYCLHCDVFFDNNSSECHNLNGHQCNTCNDIFIYPAISYTCNNCNQEFNINEASWVELVRYSLQKDNINKIRKNIFLLRDLENFLNGFGFAIKQYEKFIDKDLSVGPFELVAYKNKEVLLFIILSNDLQYNLNQVFEMDFASKIKDKEIKSFAISFFEPQEVVLRLLKKFGIIPLVKEDIKDIINEIKKYI